MKKRTLLYYLYNQILRRKIVAVSLILIAVFPEVSAQERMKVSVSKAEGKITLQVNDIGLEPILKNISGQSQYKFLYNNEEIGSLLLKDVVAKDVTLEQLMPLLLKDSKLSYKIEDGVVIISPKIQQPQTPFAYVKIGGKIVDSRGLPLPGVNVVIKGAGVGVTSDEKGNYIMKIPYSKTVTLLYSFIGMESQEKVFDNLVENEMRSNANLTMKEDNVQLNDVVVTGYGNVRKSSFTGTSTRVTREEFQKISPGSVIDALQVFDPSFRMIKNNEMGSDPNTLPEFYIRGRSGLDGVKELDKLDAADVSKFALTSNPNLPIFIMDGFEVSVEKVYDFDPNRIESITILKDAAATAIYGSRASNGIIVIETVAPKPGQLRVSYNLTGAVTAPDLSSYNLMNAREKMDVEVASGLLDKEDPFPGSGNYATRLTDYRNKMNNINMGVNTYWMSQPLRTEFNQSHSLYVDGGVESLRFSVGMQYNKERGVMKDSYRDRIGATLNLDYRYEGLQISNQVSLGIMNSEETPFGSFGDYSKMQPYYSPYDPQTGELVQVFPWSPIGGSPTNPLYNPLKTKSFDRTGYTDITDNLSINWFLKNGLQFKAQFTINRRDDKGNKFIDPTSSQYNGASMLEKGELFETRQDALKWSTNLLVAYNRSLGNHNVNATLGFNANQNRSDYTQMHYRGFPNPDLNKAKFAYEIDDHPSRSDNYTRLMGTFLSGNYTYRDIYLSDVSIRVDGSSEFGENKRFGTFWSAGVGLNIHKYEFMKRQKLITMLRIKTNYGQTGKVNFPPYISRHTYELLLDDWHSTGVGGVLAAMGNENLKWEKANTVNVGLDFSFGDWLFFNGSFYNKRTMDMITTVSLPSSAGFPNYRENVGEVLNRGLEGGFTFTLFQNKDWSVNGFLRASHNTNRIEKISNSLKEYNERVTEYFNEYDGWAYSPGDMKNNSKYSKPVMRYEEGGSLSSIFGMKSLGISPANGKELYMNRDGSVTYDWNSSEQVIIGNSDPDVMGSFGINLRYKSFSIYTSFIYEIGADSYNHTLVNDVENANVWTNNVDRRVNTERWQTSGDMAPLKDIRDRYRVTRPTSRFLQKENSVTFNSFSFGYDFNESLLKKIRFSTLRLQFNMNNIAVMSNVKQERGLSYPFARTFNFTLNTSF